MCVCVCVWKERERKEKETSHHETIAEEWYNSLPGEFSQTHFSRYTIGSNATGRCWIKKWANGFFNLFPNYSKKLKCGLRRGTQENQNPRFAVQIFVQVPPTFFLSRSLRRQTLNAILTFCMLWEQLLIGGDWIGGGSGDVVLCPSGLHAFSQGSHDKEVVVPTIPDNPIGRA